MATEAAPAGMSAMRSAPVVEVTRVYHFSAAHQLHSPSLGLAENAALYGACARVHGHNYYVEVTVRGTPDCRTGMAVDLGLIDATVRREILDAVDHQTLETIPALTSVITTGESLARAFWRVLTPVLPEGMLVSVVVRETAKNRFEYRGEAA